MSKWIIATILILALIATCAAGAFAVWQGIQMAQASGFDLRTGSFNTVEATVTEEKVIPVSGPLNLVVENTFGFVKVEAGAVDEIRLTAEKTAWGGTEEQAQQALAEIEILVEQKGDTLRVWVQPVVEMTTFHLGPRGQWVNFTLIVPVETSVELSSSSGDLTLSGTQGGAVLRTSFGDVNVVDLTGALSISTSGGKIAVRNVQAGELPIRLESSFGDIEANTLSAGDVTLETSNGNLVLEQVDATGPLKMRSQFGRLEFRSISGLSLEAETANGKITGSGGLFSGAVSLSSDFGDLTLEDVQASEITLKTKNGQIQAGGARGKITARSEYGDVTVNAENAILTLASNNGKITFTGSLAEGDHTLTSNFGDIRLTLPADSALTFDLKTDFGKIRSDFPVTISGELDEKRWKGEINGGGARLTVSTQNGNITLQMSKPK